jgi:hypothetical protein
MARTWKPSSATPVRQRPPDTIPGIARRYHACAVAFAHTRGISLGDALRDQHTSVTAIVLEVCRHQSSSWARGVDSLMSPAALAAALTLGNSPAGSRARSCGCSRAKRLVRPAVLAPRLRGFSCSVRGERPGSSGVIPPPPVEWQRDLHRRDSPAGVHILAPALLDQRLKGHAPVGLEVVQHWRRHSVERDTADGSNASRVAWCCQESYQR